MENIYEFQESGEVITPALVYYPEIIKENIRKVIQLAGGPEHLWPHVKTHKMACVAKLQLEAGITRLKCATIAEAEMAAEAGAADVLLAYPLVGPNISRFLQLNLAWPHVRFWTIGDQAEPLRALGMAFSGRGLTARVLADVNLGMDRTGVMPENVKSFFIQCSAMEGISMKGLHCYDGHRTEMDLEDRKKEAEESGNRIKEICRGLREKGYPCDTLVLGGSPSMPCYTDFPKEYPDSYFSPGTSFVNDYGYTKKFPDLVFSPGAAILTRVVSCPLKGHFTLDLGYKAIASDPQGVRGVIAGMDHVRELFQSEEHWAFCMEEGYEELCPKVGDELFVIPTHICPTTALYPSVPVVENGHLTDTWEVTARNRKVTW